MKSKTNERPGDYFLTTYERDLIRLSVKELVSKYPRMALNQMLKDKKELDLVLLADK